jgi:hypothetical protein
MDSSIRRSLALGSLIQADVLFGRHASGVMVFRAAPRACSLSTSCTMLVKYESISILSLLCRSFATRYIKMY